MVRLSDGFYDMVPRYTNPFDPELVMLEDMEREERREAREKTARKERKANYYVKSDSGDEGLRVYEKDLTLYAAIGDPFQDVQGGSGKGIGFKVDRNGWNLKLRF